MIPFESWWSTVRVLEVLVRGAVGGVLVVGPVMALAPAAGATSPVVSVSPGQAGAPAAELDPFVPWDERAERAAQQEREEREKELAAREVREGGSSDQALAATGFDAPATATLGLLTFAVVGLALVRLSRRRGAEPAR